MSSGYVPGYSDPVAVKFGAATSTVARSLLGYVPRVLVRNSARCRAEYCKGLRMFYVSRFSELSLLERRHILYCAADVYGGGTGGNR